MIRRLLLIALSVVIASAASVLAFPGHLLVGGGNPTTPPPPGTIACALGQSYTGTVPAGAAAAGFNTCALNIDMSDPYYQTLSNWMDCSFNGGAAAATPLMWFVGNGGGITCSNLSVVSDSGTTALVFTIPAGTPNGTGNGFITASPSVNAGQLFPQTMYIEFGGRLNSNANAACNNPYCLTAAFFQYRINPDPSPPNIPVTYRWTEWDWMEFYPGLDNPNRPQLAGVLHSGMIHGSDSLFSFDKGGGDPGYPSHTTADGTVKHSYASRLVSDIAGHFTWCAYFEGTLVPSCIAENYSDSGVQNDNFTFREQLVVTNQTLPTGNTAQTGDMQFYIYFIRIWECSGWNTGTTVISGRGPLAELGNNCSNSTADVTGRLAAGP